MHSVLWEAIWQTLGLAASLRDANPAARDCRPPTGAAGKLAVGGPGRDMLDYFETCSTTRSMLQV